MKLRSPWMIRLTARLGAGALRMLVKTLRCRVDSNGQNTNPWDPALHERFIYSLWHENLLGVLAFRSAAPMTTIVSNSADGEILAQMIECYGMKTIRGSSTRGGIEAVDQVLELNRSSHIMIAPDGPRGPRREVKRGLAYLAAWTRLPIVPVGLAFRRCWRVKSWDRLAIPVPGTVLCVVRAPIIHVPQGLSKHAMEEQTQLVQQSMNTADEIAQAWARGRVSTPAWPSVPAAAA